MHLGARLDLPDDGELVGLAAVLVERLGDNDVLRGAVGEACPRPGSARSSPFAAASSSRSSAASSPGRPPA